MAKSAIEWTDSTWNPVTGCTKVSPGCKHCYAERMAKRLHAMIIAAGCRSRKLPTDRERKQIGREIAAVSGDRSQKEE